MSEAIGGGGLRGGYSGSRSASSMSNAWATARMSGLVPRVQVSSK